MWQRSSMLAALVLLLSVAVPTPRTTPGAVGVSCSIANDCQTAQCVTGVCCQTAVCAGGEGCQLGTGLCVEMTPTTTPTPLAPTPTITVVPFPTMEFSSPWACLGRCTGPGPDGTCPTDGDGATCRPIFCRDRDGLERCDTQIQCIDGDVCVYIAGEHPACCPPVAVEAPVCVDGVCTLACRSGSNACIAINVQDPSEEALCLPLRECFGGCPGDCNLDGRVTVDELVSAVQIALGAVDAASCPMADLNSDHAITVDELVTAVGAALDGCP